MEEPKFKTPDTTDSDSSAHDSTILSVTGKENSSQGKTATDNYAHSTSGATENVVTTEKEAFDVSDKTIRDSLSVSKSSSSSSSLIEQTEMAVADLSKPASPLDSIETTEIISKQPIQKNDTPTQIQHQSSDSSVPMEELNTAVDSLGHSKPNEMSENATETTLSIRDSMSSLTLNMFKDNANLKLKRKSDCSADGRTVRFSIQDAEHHQQETKKDREKIDFLKSNKSVHVRKPEDTSSEDEDSFESTNLEIGHVFVYMVVPPDGGYGWFICFISFLCQIVVDGTVYSIGILLPHIAEDFNKPGSKVILIASLQTGFYFLSGTVASAFINKYGFRPVAFTGGILSITFLTLATFSVNLPMMILFHSVLGGPALSLVWVSSQLVIGYYFDKYRPIANGASCSGAGAGIMLFSLMNSVLVPELGWRNLMRLHVAFLALVMLMTLTFVEVTPTRIGRVREPLAEDSDSESLDTFYGITNYSRFSLQVHNQESSLDDNFEEILENPVTPNKERSPCCASCLEKCCPFVKRFLEYRRSLEAKKEVPKHYVIQQDLLERQDFFYSGPKDVTTTETPQVEELLKSRITLSSARHAEGSRWRIISLEEMDNAHRRNTIIRNLSPSRLLPDEQSKQYRLTYAQLKVTKRYPVFSFLSPRNWLHPKIQKAFRLLFDFRLLDIMEFRILLLSAFLFPMGFNIPFVYSTVRAQIDESFAKLITPTIGFSNFAFRIASGFVAFKFREYTTYICGGGMFFGGFAVCVSAFYGLDVVWFQFLYALCYGIAPAFFSTLRAIIYVQALGLDKLTNAFGLTALAMGLGVFMGTTAGGVLKDLTGNYTASFIFAGICICTAGALKLLLPYFISKLSKDKVGK